jgi:hypothetical protein
VRTLSSGSKVALFLEESLQLCDRLQISWTPGCALQMYERLKVNDAESETENLNLLGPVEKLS